MLLFCIIGTVLGVVNYLIRQPLIEHQQIVMIPKGASFNRIISLMPLDERYTFVLEIYARISGISRELHAGEYMIPANSSGLEILEIFESGQVVQHKITLIPGMTFKDVLNTISSQKKMVDDVKGLSNTELSQKLQLNYASPEGMFFPDTYFYVAGTQASVILKTASQRLISVLHETWLLCDKNLPYKTPYEALIMASLIEKETSDPKERSDIAGVFVRRLEKGMRLQSDPTVIFGMGDRYRGKITRKDLLEKNRYNTYRIKGLPPTPIGLVNKADLDATIHPSSKKALYFVATGDGDHIFSDTLAQHNVAVKKYQIDRKKNYRSYPVSRPSSDDDEFSNKTNNIIDQQIYH